MDAYAWTSIRISPQPNLLAKKKNFIQMSIKFHKTSEEVEIRKIFLEYQALA
jgi:hypothetical protein